MYLYLYLFFVFVFVCVFVSHENWQAQILAGNKREQTEENWKQGKGRLRLSVPLTADKNYMVNIRGISQPPHTHLEPIFRTLFMEDYRKLWTRITWETSAASPNLHIHI